MLTRNSSEVTMSGRVFYCPECRKEFLHGRNLAQHRRVVHMGVRHDCADCACSYTRMYNLTHHRLKEHPEKVTESERQEFERKERRCQRVDRDLAPPSQVVSHFDVAAGRFQHLRGTNLHASYVRQLANASTNRARNTIKNRRKRLNNRFSTNDQQGSLSSSFRNDTHAADGLVHSSDAFSSSFNGFFPSVPLEEKGADNCGKDAFGVFNNPAFIPDMGLVEHHLTPPRRPPPLKRARSGSSLMADNGTLHSPLNTTLHPTINGCPINPTPPTKGNEQQRAAVDRFGQETTHTSSAMGGNNFSDGLSATALISVTDRLMMFENYSTSRDHEKGGASPPATNDTNDAYLEHLPVSSESGNLQRSNEKEPGKNTRRTVAKCRGDSNGVYRSREQIDFGSTADRGRCEVPSTSSGKISSVTSPILLGSKGTRGDCSPANERVFNPSNPKRMENVEGIFDDMHSGRLSNRAANANTSPKTPPDDPKLFCLRCPYSTNEQSSLHNHAIRHNPNVMGQQCPLCSYVAESLIGLMKHGVVHFGNSNGAAGYEELPALFTSQEGGSFCCRYCSTRFSKGADLDKHEAMHSTTTK